MDESAVEKTIDLVARVKSGDRDALDRLCSRFLPPLRRWASGRLPRWTRDLMDTDDLVQETVMRAVNRMGTFEPRHEGALQTRPATVIGKPLTMTTREARIAPGRMVRRPGSR